MIKVLIIVMSLFSGNLAFAEGKVICAGATDARNLGDKVAQTVMMTLNARIEEYRVSEEGADVIVSVPVMQTELISATSGATVFVCVTVNVVR